MGTATSGLEEKVGVGETSYVISLRKRLSRGQSLTVARRKEFPVGKVDGEGRLAGMLGRGVRTVNGQPSGLRAVPRKTRGRLWMELFPCRPRIPGEITGQGMGSAAAGEGVDEISVTALKCPPDEPFPRMNSEVPALPFGILFAKGVEEKV